MPHTVELRFYEELNDFLPPGRRKQPFRVSFPEARSVKDLIESQGVPHSEVDLILVNGEAVGFDHRVRDGDRVSVYPTFESLDIQAAARLGRPPLRECRFVADVHLGKLARRLRLLGFDCLYNRAWDDRALAECAAAEGRILLTRDRGLLMRRSVTHAIFVRGDLADQQVRLVLARLDLARAARPFSRCLRCNAPLVEVPRAAVAGRVPAFTWRTAPAFFQCTGCQAVYWPGTHQPRLEKLVAAALAPSAPEP